MFTIDCTKLQTRLLPLQVVCYQGIGWRGQQGQKYKKTPNRTCSTTDFSWSTWSKEIPPSGAYTAPLQGYISKAYMSNYKTKIEPISRCNQTRLTFITTICLERQCRWRIHLILPVFELRRETRNQHRHWENILTLYRNIISQHRQERQAHPWHPSTKKTTYTVLPTSGFGTKARPGMVKQLWTWQRYWAMTDRRLLCLLLVLADSRWSDRTN